MKLSTEVIQTRILEDFEAELEAYYAQREKDYIIWFRKLIIEGVIDPDDANYREVCYKKAKEYKIDTDYQAVVFVKKYVNDTFDIIHDSLREGIFDNDEANAAFITLKHILVAAEIKSDNSL